MDKHEIIMQLMDALREEMQYDEEDLGSRLGREKPEPEVEVLSVEAGPMGDEMEEGMDPELEGDDAKLKKRLMGLRG